DPDLDTLVVPIGGGGLISGIATAARALKPDIEVVGVEAALYPSMSDALEHRAPRSGGLTLADGIAVKSPGVITKAIIERLVGEAGGNIIEIHHQRLFYDLPVKRADVDAVVETRNSAHVGEIVQALANAGFRTRQVIGRSADDRA